jgi:hypothetical protein
MRETIIVSVPLFQAFALFPWRAFLEDGGPFPVISSVPDTLEYDMQVDLSSHLLERKTNTGHRAGYHRFMF